MDAKIKGPPMTLAEIREYMRKREIVTADWDKAQAELEAEAMNLGSGAASGNLDPLAGSGAA